MLQRLDKFAPWALVLMMGYLTYTTVEDTGSGLIAGEGGPKTSPKVRTSALIDATAHASPVDRDPFEVSWSSYLKHAGSRQATSQPATTQPATQPAVKPTTRPAEIPPPPLPKKLSGVFLGRGVRIAVIDQQIYRVGSTIDGRDPRRCWQIEAIENTHVVLRFGDIRRDLEITDRTTGAGPARPVKGR